MASKGKSADNLENGTTTAPPPTDLRHLAPEKESISRDSTPEPLQVTYISGWKLRAVTIGLCLSLFMSMMESFIASTAIVVITDDLGDFDKSSWVFTAYLLTYSGFPIILTKVSDIFGRKPLMLLSLLLFTVFSGACGAAQTLIQLIMFRWCQGIGGSGVYSIAFVYVFELVPPQKWPDYVALLTASMSVSIIVSPLIGGAFTVSGQWRWIFLINVPLGVVAIVILFFAMPAQFSHEPSTSYARNTPFYRLLSTKTLRRLDVAGAMLLLGTCLLLSAALQEAAEGRSFSSATVVALLVLSPIFCIVFLAWQRHASKIGFFPEPIFPWRFLHNRLLVSMLLDSFFTGCVLMATIVQIPQRLTTVNGSSPLAAGTRMLPFAALIPAGSTIGAIMMGRMKIPPFYLVMLSVVLEIAGVVGLSQASTSFHIHPSQYGFQILVGLGCGISNVALGMLVPYVVDNKDLAVGTGANAQFRMLGGVVGLSIVTSVSTRTIRHKLLGVISPPLVAQVLQRTDAITRLLSGQTRADVREVFGYGYDLQMKILIGFAVVQVPVTLLMWQRKRIVISS